MHPAFTLMPEYRDYVWGGQRLRPGRLTAEAWIVYEGDRIMSGPWAGLTLAEAAAQHATQLLGRVPLARTGQRFPLLIKLLDCAQWLSVQVHPNDAQAVTLEGPGQFGKTEAWHFLQTEPGAEIMAGVKAGTSPAALAEAVRGSGLLELAQRVSVATGDTVFIPAGMLHALGPGMLLYEVQQTSNITYRVFDWNRPASDGRPLHLEQSLAVIDRSLSGQVIPAAAAGTAGPRQALIRCPYFTLERLTAREAASPTGEPRISTPPPAPPHNMGRGEGKEEILQRNAAKSPQTSDFLPIPSRFALPLDPGGKSFHLLTLTQGSARLTGTDWELELAPLQTAVVPADAGAYHLQALGECQALLASVA